MSGIKGFELVFAKPNDIMQENVYGYNKLSLRIIQTIQWLTYELFASFRAELPGNYAEPHK